MSHSNDGSKDDKSLWMDKLRRWLYKDILSHVTPDVEMRKKFVSAENMGYFVSAFTHETVEAEDNYESLEILGDALLSPLVIEYFMSEVENTPSALTEVRSSYCDARFQTKVFNKANPQPHIRVALGQGSLNVYNIMSDVFEALFGAVYIVGNTIVHGLGYSAIWNLFNWFYEGVTIDKDLLKGGFKTQVRQMVDRINNLDPPIVDKPKDRTKTPVDIRILLGPRHIKFLNSNGIDTRSLPAHPTRPGHVIIGEHSDDCKDIAEKEAYRKAFYNMKDIGLTTEWSTKTKNRMDMEIPSIKKLLPKARERLRSMGLEEDIFFETSHKISKDKNKRAIMMTATKKNPDGSITRVRLNTVEGGIVPIDAKTELLRLFTSDDPEERDLKFKSLFRPHAFPLGSKKSENRCDAEGSACPLSFSREPPPHDGSRQYPNPSRIGKGHSFSSSSHPVPYTSSNVHAPFDRGHIPSNILTK